MIERIEGYPYIGGGRYAVVQAPQERIVALLGAPTCPDCADEKVKRAWPVRTPAGLAMVRDYWWHPEGQWSIDCETAAAGEALIAWLAENAGATRTGE